MAPSALNARLRILGTAVLFSTGAVAIKGSALPIWQLAGLRAAIAGVFLLLALPAARRLRDRRVLGVGALYAVMTVSYVAANKMTTAGNVMFLVAASPLAVLVLARWLLGERAPRRDLLFLLPMGLGLVLCLAPAQPALATAPNPTLGNAFALVNLLVWAGLLVAMRALGREGTNVDNLAPAAIAAGNLMAAAVCLPLSGGIAEVDPTDWMIVFYLGLVQIGLAYIWLTTAIRRVPAFEGSLLLLAEPVLNPLWAWAGHGELPTRWAGVGGAMILLALAAKLWLVDRRVELEGHGPGR